MSASQRKAMDVESASEEAAPTEQQTNPKNFNSRVKLIMFFGSGFLFGVLAIFMLFYREFDSSTSLRPEVVKTIDNAPIMEIMKATSLKNRTFIQSTTYLNPTKLQGWLQNGTLPKPKPKHKTNSTSKPKPKPPPNVNRISDNRVKPQPVDNNNMRTNQPPNKMAPSMPVNPRAGGAANNGMMPPNKMQPGMIPKFVPGQNAAQAAKSSGASNTPGSPNLPAKNAPSSPAAGNNNAIPNKPMPNKAMPVKTNPAAPKTA